LRTCGQGIAFYLEANKDVFCGGNWASLIHKYLQKYSKTPDGIAYYAQGSGPNASLAPASAFVEFYLCPGDEVYHGSSAVWVRTKGNWENVIYPLSYGINNSLIYKIKDGVNSKNGLSWTASLRITDVPGVPESVYGYTAIKNKSVTVAPGKQNIIQLGMRKMSTVRRPFDVVMLTDTADDDMGTGIWLLDLDVGSHNSGGLQVHHKTGNNFLFADYHVEYRKILRNAYHRNVPPWPWSWVPIKGFQITKSTNLYNPYDQDYSKF
jgi:hypothetical protein